MFLIGLGALLVLVGILYTCARRLGGDLTDRIGRLASVECPAGVQFRGPRIARCAVDGSRVSRTGQYVESGPVYSPATRYVCKQRTAPRHQSQIDEGRM